MKTKLKKFLIISLDDIAIAFLVLIASYYLIPEYSIIITIIAIVALTAFLLIKYELLSPVLDDKPRVNYDLVNSVGVVIKDLDPIGLIKLNGEIWKARSIRDQIIRTGKEVVVVRRKGLLLLVDEKSDPVYQA